MSVTPDLRADEIEITTKCPDAECKVDTTHAFNQWQVNTYGMDQLKKKSLEIVTEAHQSGVHNKHMEAFNGR